MFDVLIIGGGAAGVSCALVLGSSLKKPYAEGKKVGIFTHQKASALQDGLYNNVYGIAPGTLGKDIMAQSLAHLSGTYPDVVQLPGEKVMKVEGTAGNFTIITNKGDYKARIIVVAVGSAATFDIAGLTEYIIPHKKALPEKNRIQLKNEDHLVADGIYVAGTLAGERSQLSIAAGSGAAVATDIMTLWNSGTQSQHHDSTRK
ncbi:NAD(P)/FAD-dependent oxidoreductase [Flavobacterium sp. J372]|uniref:NAD(P)/FAD-dependent oxidoreductase n=1 Tax=Flavobacterium sp. J372 TaxID=2898436 RepID=UPI002150AF1A|nr:NAD(P)/FAD-dependent oxidoreductase [Flavobacterium sp. J372]MCR5860711.1 NAD(P)/FAD-dependent oxidoreductase [Flavobacterium sp. J372]MCR5863460.1 NAD(P)/FAD-dependent oxidoreductase [Flavobacterium sp. J372]